MREGLPEGFAIFTLYVFLASCFLTFIAWEIIFYFDKDNHDPH